MEGTLLGGYRVRSELGSGAKGDGMRKVLAIALVLVAGWLLYDGETYIQTFNEEFAPRLPWVQRVVLSYRDVEFRGRGQPVRRRYDDFDPHFSEFTERASAAGTWLFAALSSTVLLLLLSLVPRLRRLHVVGCAAAVVSAGVYAYLMEGADWRTFFGEVLGTRGSHGPSVFTWLVGGLGAAGLLAGLVQASAPRPRSGPKEEHAPLAALRITGILALTALAWMTATDALWAFRVGDRSGPRGTDWGVMELGLQGARDESGAVGFKTKRNEQSYAQAEPPHGAPPGVVKLWTTARRTGRITFWTAILAALAILAAGYAPRLSRRQRASLQFLAGLALVAALLYAKFALDADADAAKARSPRLRSAPPDYGLTWAARATMLTAGLAAVAAFLSRRGASDPTDA